MRDSRASECTQNSFFLSFYSELCLYFCRIVDPDIAQRSITSNDLFLLLGCDGLFKTLSPQTCVDFVVEQMEKSRGIFYFKRKIGKLCPKKAPPPPPSPRPPRKINRTAIRARGPTGKHRSPRQRGHQARLNRQRHLHRPLLLFHRLEYWSPQRATTKINNLKCMNGTDTPYMATFSSAAPGRIMVGLRSLARGAVAGLQRGGAYSPPTLPGFALIILFLRNCRWTRGRTPRVPPQARGDPRLGRQVLWRSHVVLDFLPCQARPARPAGLGAPLGARAPRTRRRPRRPRRRPPTRPPLITT